MNLLEPIVWGLVLSADSFSAAVALGFRPHKFSDSLKFACSSGGAEVVAVIIGAMAGRKILAQFSSISQWIAFLLLFAVAAHMFYEGIKELKVERTEQDLKFHSFIKILIVSIATSIDALAVGVSLAISTKPLLPYLISIGVWAFISTIVGMAIAKQVPQRLSAIFNIIGACILLILAFQVF
ncbi:manganese efflux pump MntP family protein [Legionella gresilensis]|uniref:manganese efflux pump MntP n=1 Tax=Legionella gresilensis TaxID=91823 RepID=UPI0010410F02|nr:manganese efflux pump [Legionella gresilensis]